MIELLIQFDYKIYYLFIIKHIIYIYISLNMTTREVAFNSMETDFGLVINLKHDYNGYFHEVKDRKTDTLVLLIQPDDHKIIFSTPPPSERKRAQEKLNCDYSITNNWPRRPGSSTRKQKEMKDLKEVIEVVKAILNNNEVHI